LIISSLHIIDQTHSMITKIGILSLVLYFVRTIPVQQYCLQEWKQTTNRNCSGEPDAIGRFYCDLCVNACDIFPASTANCVATPGGKFILNCSTGYVRGYKDWPHCLDAVVDTAWPNGIPLNECLTLFGSIKFSQCIS
jgi:hypothetical protein